MFCPVVTPYGSIIITVIDISPICIIFNTVAVTKNMDRLYLGQDITISPHTEKEQSNNTPITDILLFPYHVLVNCTRTIYNNLESTDDSLLNSQVYYLALIVACDVTIIYTYHFKGCESPCNSI